MLPGLRHVVRTLRRDPRPVLAALLVLAQGVAAVGCPVFVRAGDSLRPCGCKVRGPSAECCCGPSACGDLVAETIPPVVEPDPESPCPMCATKSRAKPAAATETVGVAWLAVVKARQCHGESPLGLMAEITAIPPVLHDATAFAPRLTDSISLGDHFATSAGSIPPEPPPRRG